MDLLWKHALKLNTCILNLNNRQYSRQDSFCNMDRNRYMYIFALCNHLDKFHFYRFSTVFRQWTGNGPEMDRKWTDGGPKVSQNGFSSSQIMKLFLWENFRWWWTSQKFVLEIFSGFNTMHLNLSLDILADICSHLYNKY